MKIFLMGIRKNQKENKDMEQAFKKRKFQVQGQKFLFFKINKRRNRRLLLKIFLMPLKGGLRVIIAIYKKTYSVIVLLWTQILTPHFLIQILSIVGIWGTLANPSILQQSPVERVVPSKTSGSDILSSPEPYWKNFLKENTAAVVTSGVIVAQRLESSWQTFNNKKLNKQINKYQDQLNKAEAEKQAQLKLSEETTKTFKENLQQQQTTIDKLMTMVDPLQTKIVDLTEELGRVNAESMQKTNEIKLLTSKIESLQQKETKTLEKMHSLEKEHGEEITQYKKNIQKLEAEVRSLEDTEKSLQKQLADLQNEFQESSTISQKELTELKEKIANTTSERDALKQEARTLENSLRTRSLDLKLAQDDLKIANDNYTKLQDQVKDLEDQLKKEEYERGYQLGSFHTVETQIRKDYDLAQEELLANRNLLRESQETNSFMIEEKETLESQLKEKQQEIDTLKADVSKLSDLVTDYETRISNTLANKQKEESLLEAISELKQEKERLILDTQKIKKDTSNALSEYKNLSAEISNLRNEIEPLTTVKDSMVSEMDELKIKKDNLEQQVTSAQDNLQKLEKQTNKLKRISKRTKTAIDMDDFPSPPVRAPKKQESYFCEIPALEIAITRKKHEPSLPPPTEKYYTKQELQDRGVKFNDDTNQPIRSLWDQATRPMLEIKPDDPQWSEIHRQKVRNAS